MTNRGGAGYLSVETVGACLVEPRFGRPRGLLASAGASGLIVFGKNSGEQVYHSHEDFENARRGLTTTCGYPGRAIKGWAGGKLPTGNFANRSPRRSFSDASRNCETNQA